MTFRLTIKSGKLKYNIDFNSLKSLRQYVRRNPKLNGYFLELIKTDLGFEQFIVFKNCLIPLSSAVMKVQDLQRMANDF